MGDARGPSGVVMAVRGDKIRQALPDDLPARGLDGKAGVSGQGGGVDLKEAARILL